MGRTASERRASELLSWRKRRSRRVWWVSVRRVAFLTAG
jgi:hypothetical protein